VARKVKFQRLGQEEAAVLKGGAILAIVLHNYYHFLIKVSESEFDFSPDRFPAFWAAAQDPRYTFQSVFSYFGHFGVQLFIFLSAYGLAMKYSATPPRWAAFLWDRGKRLYPMFLAVIVIWVLVTALPHGLTAPFELLRRSGTSLLLTVLGVSNFVPGYGLPPIGPWWFMPFIMQFYCIWPLLVRLVNRFGRAGLCVLACTCFGLTFAVNDALVTRFNINLLMSPIGHMPELCLGIAAARYGNFLLGAVWTVTAGVVFALGNIYQGWWLLTFVSALILLLNTYSLIRPVVAGNSFLLFVGGISLPVFLVNGFTRKYFLLIAQHYPSWPVGLVMGFANAVAAILFALVLSRFLTSPAIPAKWRGKSNA
jgi:peptidoglycan/LPS O-acetylase OafA/YrhL